MTSILKNSALLLTALIIAKSASAGDAAWRVSYYDGSANAFHAWQDAGAAEARFEYLPVRPEQSSTGMYSGGERKSGRLEKKDVAALRKRVRRLESDKSHRAESRDKGTGLFVLEDADGKREFLLEMGAWLNDFDRFLRDMPSFKNASRAD